MDDEHKFIDIYLAKESTSDLMMPLKRRMIDLKMLLSFWPLPCLLELGILRIMEEIFDVEFYNTFFAYIAYLGRYLLIIFFLKIVQCSYHIWQAQNLLCYLLW